MFGRIKLKNQDSSAIYKPVFRNQVAEVRNPVVNLKQTDTHEKSHVTDDGTADADWKYF